MALGSTVIYLALSPVKKEEKPVENPSFKPNNAMITGYRFQNSIKLFGEEVPLDRLDVMERLDREIQVNAFWHSNTILTIKRANKWFPQIDSVLNVEGIPSDFKYLTVIESGLQNVVSPKKAVGFWQFLKGTAKEYGLEVNSKVDQRYDPILSTLAACKYLKDGYNRFGNWTVVAASYNMGMNGMDEALTKQQVESYYDLRLSEEPARYIYRLIALREILENQQAFGFYIPSEALYIQEPSNEITVTRSIPDLVNFAKDYGTTYNTLKRLNPWIRAYELPVSGGRQYTMKVPK